MTAFEPISFKSHSHPGERYLQPNHFFNHALGDLDSDNLTLAAKRYGSEQPTHYVKESLDGLKALGDAPDQSFEKYLEAIECPVNVTKKDIVDFIKVLSAAKRHSPAPTTSS